MTTRYLKNRETGNVFIFTEALSQLSFMKEIDANEAHAIEVAVKEVPEQEAVVQAAIAKAKK